jgi:hypothetical protein
MSADPATPAAVATPTRLESLSAAIAQVFPGGLTSVANHTGELTSEVPAERLLAVAPAFRHRVSFTVYFTESAFTASGVLRRR